MFFHARFGVDSGQASVELVAALPVLAVALFNIGVQLSAPRWVAGRSLAAFQAAIAGGIAIGSWGWGHLTDFAGLHIAEVLALMQACDRAVYGDSDWTEQELREEWEGLDLEQDAWLAVDGGATIA